MYTFMNHENCVFFSRCIRRKGSSKQVDIHEIMKQLRKKVLVINFQSFFYVHLHEAIIRSPVVDVEFKHLRSVFLDMLEGSVEKAAVSSTDKYIF